MRKFACVWLNPVYDERQDIVTGDYFIDPINGYMPEEVHKIEELEVGQCFMLPYGDFEYSHFVTRIR